MTKKKDKSVDYKELSESLAEDLMVANTQTYRVSFMACPAMYLFYSLMPLIVPNPDKAEALLQDGEKTGEVLRVFLEQVLEGQRFLGQEETGEMLKLLSEHTKKHNENELKEKEQTIH